MSFSPEDKRRILKCTYVSEVALHPLDDINASDSVLKNVNLQGEGEAALKETLYLDAQREDTRNHMH